MKKNICVSSTLFWGASLESIFSFLRTNNIKTMELWAEHFDFFQFDINEYIGLARQSDVKTIVHSKSWDLNFASLNKTIRESSLKEIKNCIDLAEQLGATEVTIHPPRKTVGGISEITFDLAYQGFKDIVLYAKDKNITISVEIMEKIAKEILIDVDSFNKILKDLADQVACTLDIAHCTDEKEFFSYLEAMKNISKIHISNKIGKFLHSPIYEGDFNFLEILPRIESYNVDLVLEGLDTSEDHQIIKKSLAYIAQMEEKNEKNSTNSFIGANESLSFCRGIG